MLTLVADGFVPYLFAEGAYGTRLETIADVPKGRTVSANGREFDGPIHVARRATLGEISFVDLGADGQTSASVAANQGEDETEEEEEK